MYAQVSSGSRYSVRGSKAGLGSLSFSFTGQLSSSKSLHNRALILKSYFPQLNLRGVSLSDDVHYLESAVNTILSGAAHGSEINCGHGAAVFRFLAMRLARLKGEFKLLGSGSLFGRPHDELYRCLRQLSCSIEIFDQALALKSDGWHLMGDQLNLSTQRSSQFASAVLLNSWMLPCDLYMTVSRESLSGGYLDLTIEFLRSVGMTINRNSNEIAVPKNQSCTVEKYLVECDMDNAFVLAALAARFGELKVMEFPKKSLQPSYQFVEVLHKMGANISVQDGQLRVVKTEKLGPIDINLSDAPDLFPVLSALLSQVNGRSKLFGAPHLKYKESNRIERVSELLTKCNIEHRVLDDGLEINGKGGINVEKSFEYDVSTDHRLAHGASIFMKAGAKINLIGKESVNKSFAGYWELLGL